MYAGKCATPEVLESIRHKMGLDKPVWINVAEAHKQGWTHIFDSQFFDVLFFRFPKSMRYDEPVGTLFWRKAPVSFAIQFPVFIIELGHSTGIGAARGVVSWALAGLCDDLRRGAGDESAAAEYLSDGAMAAGGALEDFSGGGMGCRVLRGAICGVADPGER